jgi:hypothetical protein
MISKESFYLMVLVAVSFPLPYIVTASSFNKIQVPFLMIAILISIIAKKRPFLSLFFLSVDNGSPFFGLLNKGKNVSILTRLLKYGGVDFSAQFKSLFIKKTRFLSVEIWKKMQGTRFELEINIKKLYVSPVEAL